MTGPKPIPRGFLGMLVLMLIVEATIASRRLDFTTVWADDWRRTAEAATREARDRDVLCFGDSLVKFGVLPKVVEAESGLKTYNLAVNAGTMPSAYFLLRRSIESGARPKAIVADFFALMLPDQPMLSVRTYPDLATARDVADLAWTSRDASFLSTTLLGKLLPSYKCRFEIRASILGAFEGRRASSWPREAVVWSTWKANDGAQPMPSMPIRPPVDLTVVARLAPERWSVDAINAAYFEKFLSLAAEHKLPVFWLMPPLGPDVHAHRGLVGSDLAYGELAREAQRRYPNVTVLDARASGYDDSVHIDLIHLDHRGAAVLSGDVARAMADRLGGRSNDRWVDLPAFAGRTDSGAKAEVAGSKSAVNR